jgi:hypothetical protein
MRGAKLSLGLRPDSLVSGSFREVVRLLNFSNGLAARSD